MPQSPISPARRLNSRVETPDFVWVYWRYERRDDTSRVRNLGPGGLFVETTRPGLVGAKAQLEFLVQEGQIRTDAVVRHVKPGVGIGLKFTAVKEGDRKHLAALLNRLRRSF